MTVNELVDRLVEVEQSLRTSGSPQLLNESILKEVRTDINDIISDLEHDGIDSNDGFRKVYQGGY
tara:strand:+ start:140 stop:334 length:195 start_codon:yes stop_codon:yes gene_type:complete